jgi:hypothetical protein
VRLFTNLPMLPWWCLQVLPELSLEDTALFFARAGAAAYDASITGWKVGVQHMCTRNLHMYICKLRRLLRWWLLLQYGMH